MLPEKSSYLEWKKAKLRRFDEILTKTAFLEEQKMTFLASESVEV